MALLDAPAGPCWGSSERLTHEGWVIVVPDIRVDMATPERVVHRACHVGLGAVGARAVGLRTKEPLAVNGARGVRPGQTAVGAPRWGRTYPVIANALNRLGSLVGMVARSGGQQPFGGCARGVRTARRLSVVT